MSRGYLLPLSHSSFPLPDTSFSLSSHPYPEGPSSRVVDSNGGKCDNPPRKIPYYRLRPIHFGR
jgi:hypothetical protein